MNHIMISGSQAIKISTEMELELNGNVRVVSFWSFKDFSGIPEILEVAYALYAQRAPCRDLISMREKYRINFTAASDNFLQMMGIGVLRGEIQTSNSATYYLAISERKAVEIFGSVENTLGKRIKTSVGYSISDLTH